MDEKNFNLDEEKIFVFSGVKKDIQNPKLMDYQPY